MVNQAYPSLNGIEPSWADIEVTSTISGGALLTLADIAAIKWGRKIEVGKKRGASGGRVMSRTTGQLDHEGSMTLYRTGNETLLTKLAAVAPTRGNQAIVSLVSFDILIQYSPPGSSALFQVKLKGCRYLGDSDDAKESADPDKVDVTIDPIEIVNLINGQEIALL